MLFSRRCGVQSMIQAWYHHNHPRRPSDWEREKWYYIPITLRPSWALNRQYLFLFSTRRSRQRHRNPSLYTHSNGPLLTATKLMTLSTQSCGNRTLASSEEGAEATFAPCWPTACHSNFTLLYRYTIDYSSPPSSSLRLYFFVHWRLDTRLTAIGRYVNFLGQQYRSAFLLKLVYNNIHLCCKLFFVGWENQTSLYRIHYSVAHLAV